MNQKKVLTINIRFQNDFDGIQSWDNRKNLIATEIIKQDIDIFVTQEGRESQLRELEKLCLDYTLVDSHRLWVKERMYPSIFIKKNRYKVIESRDIWLSLTPNIIGSSSFGSAFPRLACVSLLEDAISKLRFYIVNAHLDHEQECTREKQVQVLVRELRALSLKKTPLILMGDYNTGPDSLVYDSLCSGLELRDPWKYLGFSEESSYHKFLGHFPDGKRIDWLLHNKFFKAQRIEMIKTQKNGIYLSDHFAIMSELKF